jgi:NitT/TauT family transport system substrate-binding protein
MENGLRAARREMKMKKFCLVLIAILLSVLSCAVKGHTSDAEGKNGRSAPVLHFGTLPVLQALPLFVAAEKGYFKTQGVTVDLVLFNSAMEKDVALSSGQISGYFGDLMTPMILAANKIPVKMAATIYNTTARQRMFAILAASKTANKGLDEIVQAGIAGSSNTIIEYLMARLLASKNIPASKLNMIEVKSIPIRLQMLLSDQVPAAGLPEPLVTLAEMKGARVLLDDAGPGLSATVLAFRNEFLNSRPATVRAFLAAVAKASAYVNRNPDDVRSIMNRECKVPEPLQQTFPIPVFPKLTLPASSQVMDVYRWLREKRIVKTEMTLQQMVADGYLP